MIFFKDKYRVCSNKCSRSLLNFEALKCDGYWRVVINRERDLFLSKNSNSYEILKLCHFLFLGNDKQLFL